MKKLFFIICLLFCINGYCNELKYLLNEYHDQRITDQKFFIIIEKINKSHDDLEKKIFQCCLSIEKQLIENDLIKKIKEIEKEIIQATNTEKISNDKIYLLQTQKTLDLLNGEFEKIMNK